MGATATSDMGDDVVAHGKSRPEDSASLPFTLARRQGPRHHHHRLAFPDQ